MKTNKINITANAKVNFGLRITGRRKDGFHNLETIFYPLKLADKIQISIKRLKNSQKSSISVKTVNLKNVKEKDNLCYRAAEIFLKEFSINTPVNIIIKVKKNIPTGAGLGGGSSDAAAVLLALKKYFRIKGKEGLLRRCALKLGSDVPFFLLNKPAYAAGRGEILKRLKNFTVRKNILIVNPGIHISTPWAFKELGIKGSRKKLMNKVSRYSPADPVIMINDFERIVFKKYPRIEKIKYDMFALGAEYAIMSGSGSTVFGVFGEKYLNEAKKYFRNKKYKVFVS